MCWESKKLYLWSNVYTYKHFCSTKAAKDQHSLILSSTSINGIMSLLRFKDLLCIWAKWGPRWGWFLKDMLYLAMFHLWKQREKSTVFLPGKHEGAVRPNVATGKTDLGLNASGRWCRKVSAEAGAQTFLRPTNPPCRHSRAHGLHSHCWWDPRRVSRSQTGILLRREQKEIAKSLFVCHWTQVPPAKALLSVLHYWPGLTVFSFSAQGSASAPQVACKSVLHLLSNVRGYVFWQIPCCFCYSEVLFYHCSGMSLQALEQTHRWSLCSKAGDCSAPYLSLCLWDNGFQGTTVFFRKAASKFDFG